MGLENKAASSKNRSREWRSGVTGAGYLPADLTTRPIVARRPKKLVVLHWLTVLCIGMAVALILTRALVDGRTLRAWLLEGHRNFGLFVLLLFVARIVLRVSLGKLPRRHRESFITRWLAALNHAALYALMLALPLLGWALSSAELKPVHLLGFTLPALVKGNADLADELLLWHQTAAWVLLVLVSLHVAAALWHHFVLRDGVLKAMLPGRSRR